jgi:hypothetical protein
MSFWYRDADIPSNFTAAGGIGSLEAIASAGRKQIELVDNTNATVEAINRAYDQRIAAIKDKTGITLAHPMLLAEQTMLEQARNPRFKELQPENLDQMLDRQGPDLGTPAAQEARKFAARLTELEQQFPQYRDTIKAGVPIEKDAEALAKQADDDFARLMASRPGFGKYVAAFAGSFMGSLHDPVQVATMFLGGGAGAGRSVMARVANVALKEALVNGAVEAAMQPQVQAWREKLGLPHGFDEGMWNVLFAAGAGGLLGGGAEFAGAATRRALTGTWLDKGAEEVRKLATLDASLRAALDGDHDRALELLGQIPEALSPEARQAVEMHETRKIALAALPESSRIAERNLDEAYRAANNPYYEPDFQIDREKVARIAQTLVPETRAPATPKEKSLAEFLIRAGGVQDQKGEISALGMQNSSERFTGKLVRENGRPLDDARLIAAEAGYFNHLYGTPDEAAAKSTVADLLDGLDAANRRTNAPEDDGGRAYVERQIEDVLKIGGPMVDDKLVARVVQRAENDGTDIVTAWDAEHADAVQPPTELPNLDRERNDFDPGAPDDAELLTPEDFAALDPLATIPFFDDAPPMTAAQAMDFFEQFDAKIRATEVCRL